MTAAGEPVRPLKVYVQGRPFSIQWLSEQAWNELGPRGGEACGVTDVTSHSIVIRTYVGRADGPEASISQMQDTLMHEIIHVLFYVTPVRKFVASEKILKAQGSEGSDESPGVEEWFADNLAIPLITLVRDNPKVWDWLTWKEF